MVERAPPLATVRTPFNDINKLVVALKMRFLGLLDAERRWYYTVFAGEERLSKEAKAHLHESPRIMTVPLVILADAMGILAGWGIAVLAVDGITFGTVPA